MSSLRKEQLSRKQRAHRDGLREKETEEMVL